MTNILEQVYDAAFDDNNSLADLIDENVAWNVSFPLNEINGLSNVKQHYFSWIKNSLADVERKPFISIEGDYNGEHWIAATGYLVGTFSKDLLSIPATHKSLFLRYSEIAEIKDNKVVRCYTFIDFIDAMNQAGVNPIRPSLGHDGLVMPPTTLDGIPQTVKDSEHSIQSEHLVESMLTELGQFDGKSLSSMNLGKFWHPDFIWYGPAGIGTTRGIDGFRKHHQGPFLAGFPDRGINKTLCLISHNNFVATGGWPHMYGTHTGDNWLGLTASGKTVYPRVLDFWRREGQLLRENWVAIDIPDMLNQMGINVFELMQEQIKNKLKK